MKFYLSSAALFLVCFLVSAQSWDEGAFKGSFDQYIGQFVMLERGKDTSGNTRRYLEMLKHGSEHDIQSEVSRRIYDDSRVREWAVLVQMLPPKPSVRLQWLRDKMDAAVLAQDASLLNQIQMILNCGNEGDAIRFRSLAKNLQGSLRDFALRIARNAESSMAADGRMDPRKERKIPLYAKAEEDDRWEAEHPELFSDSGPIIEIQKENQQPRAPSSAPTGTAEKLSSTQHQQKTLPNEPMTQPMNWSVTGMLFLGALALLLWILLKKKAVS